MPNDGRDLAALMAGASVEALYRAGEDLLGKAQRLAPKDEGTLRGSFAIALIVNGRRYEGAGAEGEAIAAAKAAARAGISVRADVEVSANTVYAARQHEETGWRHRTGQAKYLSTPLHAGAARYERIIGLAARAALS